MSPMHAVQVAFDWASPQKVLAYGFVPFRPDDRERAQAAGSKLAELLLDLAERVGMQQQHLALLYFPAITPELTYNFVLSCRGTRCFRHGGSCCWSSTY